MTREEAIEDGAAFLVALTVWQEDELADKVTLFEYIDHVIATYNHKSTYLMEDVESLLLYKRAVRYASEHYLKDMVMV